MLDFRIYNIESVGFVSFLRELKKVNRKVNRKVNNG